METQAALDLLAGELFTASRIAPGADIGVQDAKMAAWWFLQAELLGLPAFGVSMAGREIQRLAGIEAPSPDPPARGLIDAATLPGHVALAAAVRQISEAAGSAGVHAVAIRNVGALGILGSAARELALSGFVSLVIANSAPIVAPWGGTQPALGTNPIAAAAPHGEGALVVDFSTSSLTVAELRQARAGETELPEPGALDGNGKPTNDPLSARALLPPSLEGTLSGFVVELLTGVALGRDWEAGRSALVVAIDPAFFGTDAAATSEDFARGWVAAGGHLPSRFNALPHSPAGAPTTLDLEADEVWEKLRKS